MSSRAEACLALARSFAPDKEHPRQPYNIFNQPKEGNMAAKWKYIIITEDLEVYGSDDRNEVMKFCRDAEAADGNNNIILENSEDGVFRLNYTAEEEEVEAEEGDVEVEAEVEELLTREEIEAL